LKDLTQKVQDQENLLKTKEFALKDLERKLREKDRDIKRLATEGEKMSKTIMEKSEQDKSAKRTLEEALHRKSKEVEALQKEKKCKNCFLCLEELKDKSPDMRVKEMNNSLIQKASRIAQLEDQVRKLQNLMGQLCSHNYNMLLSKCSEYRTEKERIKSEYEKNVMGIEEQLTLEKKRCDTVIQERVPKLETDVANLRKQEKNLQR